MRPLLAAAALAAGLGLAGCQPAVPTPQDVQFDRMAVELNRNTHVNNAIVRQQTLYEYHFTPYTPDLNDLGWHDLSVLAGHYRVYPGRLNVHRGTADAQLYRARVQTVTAGLARAGVPRGRMQITDALPGGDGMHSDRVIKVLQRPIAPAELDTDLGSDRSYTGE